MAHRQRTARASRWRPAPATRRGSAWRCAPTAPGWPSGRSPPRKVAISSSARKASSGAGSQPFVRTTQVAVALEVGRHPSDRLAQTQVLGEVVSHGGQAGPDRDGRGVPPGLLGGLLPPCARNRSRVSSVKNVCRTTSSKARPPRARDWGPKAVEQPSGMSSSNLGAQVQQGPGPRGPVVAEHDLAVPEPAHQAGEVLHLRRGHAGGCRRGPWKRRDAPADAQRGGRRSGGAWSSRRTR